MQIFTHGYALLIGVGATTYRDWALPVTVNDARAILTVLADPDVCAYPEGNIRFLHDGDATRDAILEGLNWLQARSVTDPEATIIVYYSGHGWLDQTTGGYYLIPHDVKPFAITESALAATDFITHLRQVKAERLLVLIDSCHAEGMATSKDGKGPELPAGFKNMAMPDNLLAELKRGQGRAVFTSSRGSQLSWIRPDRSLSIFTDHLIEALKGVANDSQDTVVRISNLMNHLSRSVPTSARDSYSAEQSPFFDMAAEDFPVAMLYAGKGLAATEHRSKNQNQPRSQEKTRGGVTFNGPAIITGDVVGGNQHKITR